MAAVLRCTQEAALGRAGAAPSAHSRGGKRGAWRSMSVREGGGAGAGREGWPTTSQEGSSAAVEAGEEIEGCRLSAVVVWATFILNNGRTAEIE